MGIHSPAAVLALPARRYAGNQNAVTQPQRGYAWADSVDHADPFVTQGTTRCAGGDIALQDVQVRTADRGPRNFHDGVAGPCSVGLDIPREPCRRVRGR